jgi:hypothetical protein
MKIDPRIAVLAVTVVTTTRAAAADVGPMGSGWYAAIGGGPALASFAPAGDAGVPEHLVTSATQMAVEIGYGIGRPTLRVDVALRLQELHLDVAGRYTSTTEDNAFRAGYDYLAPLLVASIATRSSSPVQIVGGLSLGTATYVSTPQGGPVSVRQIPVYGNLEAGITLRLADWLEGRAELSWLPPVSGLDVLAPQIGLRAGF